MAAASEPTEIDTLLTDLKSPDPEVCLQAIRRLVELKADTPEVVQGLSDAAQDENSSVAAAAREALAQSGHPPPTPGPAQPLPLPAPRWPRAPWINFLVGFFGWFLFNTVIWAWLSRRDDALALIIAILILPTNLVVLLILVITRKRPAALGMLAAIALNLVISLVLRLQTNAQCGIPFLIR